MSTVITIESLTDTSGLARGEFQYDEYQQLAVAEVSVGAVRFKCYLMQPNGQHDICLRLPHETWKSRNRRSHCAVIWLTAPDELRLKQMLIEKWRSACLKT